MRLDPEPPGAHCAKGGTAVRAGTDADGDGILSDAEITSTSYVCNGPDGSAGSTALVRLDPEAPGANCAHGGLAVKAGLDANHDGILQDSEVTSTSYACNGLGGGVTVIDGSYVVRNSLDVAFLAGVTKITGNLTVDAVGLSGLTLSALTSVGGDILLQNGSSPFTLSLPALTTIGGDLSAGAVLASLDLRSLTTVGGLVYLTGLNSGLTSLSGLSALVSVGGSFKLVGLAVTTLAGLGSLSTVGGNVLISSNNSLTSADLSGLTSIGLSLGISGNAALTSVAMRNLKNVGGSVSIGGAVLASVVLSGLSSVGGNPTMVGQDGLFIGAGSTGAARLANLTLGTPITIGGALMVSGTALTSLGGLSGLTTVGTNLTISGNPALTTLGMSSLTKVSGSFAITGNAALPTCRAQALLNQLATPPGGGSTILGNASACF